jgi:hypothetical protein
MLAALADFVRTIKRNSSFIADLTKPPSNVFNYWVLEKEPLVFLPIQIAFLCWNACVLNVKWFVWKLGDLIKRCIGLPYVNELKYHSQLVNIQISLSGYSGPLFLLLSQNILCSGHVSFPCHIMYVLNLEVRD